MTPTLTYNVDSEGRPWKMTASSGQNPVTSTPYNTASQVTSVTYGSGDSDSFSFGPNTQLPTGYTINVGAKSQTATIMQNANHTMRQLAITDTIFSNQNQTCVFGYDEFMRLTSDKFNIATTPAQLSAAGFTPFRVFGIFANGYYNDSLFLQVHVNGQGGSQLTGDMGGVLNVQGHIDVFNPAAGYGVGLLLDGNYDLGIGSVFFKQSARLDPGC